MQIFPGVCKLIFALQIKAFTILSCSILLLIPLSVFLKDSSRTRQLWPTSFFLIPMCINMYVTDALYIL